MVRNPNHSRLRSLFSRRPAPLLITDAPEDPERELRRREIRYVIMMLTRALCLVAGAVIVSTKPPLWGLWLVLCVAGMVLLPWLAVILANDRPPKRKAERHRPPVRPTPSPLPSSHSDRVVDG
ncbi:MAG TPA: DUF3099 domain-containing protein [Micromonosporaceae bacterium]